MSETFFESPFYLYAALVLSELALAALWYERRTRRLARLLLVPPLLAACVGLLAYLVVTDREQIVAATRDIADAVSTGQFDRVPAHLDEEFTATLPTMRVTKAEVVGVCRAEVRRWAIGKVTFGMMSVEISGRQAKMRVTTFVLHSDPSAARTALTWDVSWSKGPIAWKVSEVTNVRLGVEL